EVFDVLVGETRGRQIDVRQRDPLVVADAPAGDDDAAHLVGRRGLDAQLDHAVVHPDLVTGLDPLEVLRRRDENALARAYARPPAERERPAGLEVHSTAAALPERAQADLRPLQILK